MTRLGTRERVRGVAPHAWAVVLVVVLLGPALLPGYVLSYDLVFVPRLALRPDFLGLATALPRAVPSDAVVAVVDNLLGGQLLEKVVLAGSLLAAAEGALRLVDRSSLAARLTAVSVTVWNPFTVERLWIGHWTLLLAYAVVPWLVLAGRRARSGDRFPLAACGLLPIGSLSASAGLVSGAVLLACGLRRRGPRAGRDAVLLVAACLAANAPWWVAGLLHAGSTTSDAGTDLFGLHPEGSLPAPLAALTLGGIWNADVVPASRHGALAWLALAGLVAAALLGARRWWHALPAGEGPRLAALAGAGWGLAVLTWAAPGLVDVLAAHVPGAGVLRDGARALALCLPVWVGIWAAGAQALAERFPAGAPARVAAGLAFALFPLVALPDAAWGISGALRPADFPTSWSTARDVVDPDHGDVLVLPLDPYRAPAWNHGHTVLDPLGRYLRPDYLAGDDLLVSGRVVVGEDPRVPRAARALALQGPAARAAALARLGFGYVAVERDAAPAQPRVAGRVLVDAPDLAVVALADPTPREVPLGWRLAVGAAWTAFLALPVVGLLGALRRRRGVDALAGNIDL